MGNVTLEADCPFCGHDEVIISEEATDDGEECCYQAECKNCGAKGPQAFEDANDAVRQWNKRVTNNRVSFVP
jgi:Lar family restriction alleviation protein